MEWGTRTAIDNYRKLYNRVPDVVYDLGAMGKEPMVRLLAHRAVDMWRSWVWRLRGGWVKNSRVLRKEFPHLKELCGDHLWAASCYHGPVGAGRNVVEKYISVHNTYEHNSR